MYQLQQIKLIIWDLDETFWHGTLSEGGITIPDTHADLIRRLTDAGIVNSICSKNDLAPVEAALTAHGLREYFVFPSVNWMPKGERIRDMIGDMGLRAVNVLFLDDNPSNRGEAEHCCPGIMVEGPEVIPQLIQDVKTLPAKDKAHKRLNQYKVLEEKRAERTHYASNEEFLMESDIRLTISPDCREQIPRIHDLILRANQLNFTKLRSTERELETLLAEDGVEAGCVSVADRFGDYGIVGFYAVKDGCLVHFVFSCRTLGMGIEQYVYNHLGRPALDIVGEVISDLSDTRLPPWINQSKATEQTERMTVGDLRQHQVLIKGPCDLYQVFAFIDQTELMDTEFTYTTDRGFVIESTGHTTHIVEALRLSEKQKERVIAEVPFADLGMYSDRIFRNPYRVVVVSILADANLGVYRRKDTGERLACLEGLHPLTDPACWEKYISGEYYTAGFPFTWEILRAFAAQYEFIGVNSPETIVENLKQIRHALPKDCMLAIMLGGELYYEKNRFEAYRDRHLVHRAVNAAVRCWAEGREDVRLIDVNRYLVDQRSFYDHFNHYSKPVYYKLAQEIATLIRTHTGKQVRHSSKLKLVKARVRQVLAGVWHWVKDR